MEHPSPTLDKNFWFIKNKIMEILRVVKTKKFWSILIGVLLVIGLGYVVGRVWRTPIEFLRQLPASLQRPVETPQPEKTSETLEKAPETLKLEEVPLPGAEAPGTERKESEPRKYLEKAQKGEGLTHLARRVLKEYLKENPQNFEVTKEHKIYIEDYLAKSLGGRWLQLGEEVNFSEELIREALNKAQALTPVQLQNLSQFVPLVPSL